ncbi:MAG: hypothetical protein A2X18_07575 [Bacteroidetes bacterium GWF2_40_14]|nr:MAG: hypothetical protein A2X18_07575 [Bacteroidetes bacterium GWF2_40_14]
MNNNIIESVIIYNENKLVGYIDGTSSLSEKHAKETTSLEEIKKQILSCANSTDNPGFDYGFQVECMKDWDKVHVFKFMRIDGKELSVSYQGTMK